MTICYPRAQLLMSHEHFNALFLLSLYLTVSWFFSNKGFCLLILISTHWLLTSLFPMSFQQLVYNSHGFFVCVYLFVLFQISDILNVCNSESFHGVSGQLQSLMSERFRLEEERAWARVAGRKQVSAKVNGEGGELDPSVRHAFLLAEAVDLAGDGNTDEQPRGEFSTRKTIGAVCQWEPNNYGFVLGG